MFQKKKKIKKNVKNFLFGNFDFYLYKFALKKTQRIFSKKKKIEKKSMFFYTERHKYFHWLMFKSKRLIKADQHRLAKQLKSFYKKKKKVLWFSKENNYNNMIKILKYKKFARNFNWYKQKHTKNYNMYLMKKKNLFFFSGKILKKTKKTNILFLKPYFHFLKHKWIKNLIKKKNVIKTNKSILQKKTNRFIYFKTEFVQKK